MPHDPLPNARARPHRPMRFHWSLSQAGESHRRARATAVQSGLTPFEAQLALCRQAEESGIDSVLMAIGYARPDPLVLATALARRTSTVKFMIACRAGLISPVLFTQQVNTLSAISGGRVHVNMVVGHTPRELGYYGDTLDHNSRYERVGEFIEVCRQLWEGAEPVTFRGSHYRVENAVLNTPFVSPTPSSPEVYLGGSSGPALELAARYGCCLWRLARQPGPFGEDLAGLLDSGGEAGLLVSLIARRTTGEAAEAAEALVAEFGEPTRAVHRDFEAASDSVGFRSTYDLARNGNGPWLGSCLWTGAVPYLGAPAVALVGSYDDVARALIDYRRVGVTQVLLMGWPDIEEMATFSREVAPRVRALEAAGDGEFVAGRYVR